MLLTESERAKQLRTRILDIVIATINGRAGGGPKYINWRDRGYPPTAIKSENYRKNFTQAVISRRSQIEIIHAIDDQIDICK